MTANFSIWPAFVGAIKGSIGEVEVVPALTSSDLCFCVSPVDVALAVPSIEALLRAAMVN